MKTTKSFIFRHFEGSLIALILVGIAAIALLVQFEFAFLNFFFLPVILSGYYLGKKKAVLTAILCILLVFLYFIYLNLFTKPDESLDFNTVIQVLTWGCFLVVTAGIIGGVSEQRETKVRNLGKAYIGVLDILLRYLEAADEVQPRSLRAAALAGRIADRLGLDRRDIENIKSAALLYESDRLPSSLSLLDQAADFVKDDLRTSKSEISSRERVLVTTAACLMKEVEPLLTGYFRHYVEYASVEDKNLEAIPIGSAVLALIKRYIKTFPKGEPTTEEKLAFLAEVGPLKGRTYPEPVLAAFREAIFPS